MFKKLIFLFALLFCTYRSVSAAYALVVNVNPGSGEEMVFSFLIDDKPVITSFDGTNEKNFDIYVEGNSVAIPFSMITDIKFEEVSEEGLNVRSLPNDLMTVVGPDLYRFNPEINVSVCDISVHTLPVVNNGLVSLQACPPGIYIFSYNNKSLKVIKK